MSIFLPPQGESIALPAMAPARKSAKTSKRKSAATGRSRKASAKKGKKAAKKKKAPSVITRIKQPEHATGSNGANSSINLYLNEIAQYELITVEEECALADRIKAGDESAEQELINANLRLVSRTGSSIGRRGAGRPMLGNASKSSKQYSVLL